MISSCMGLLYEDVPVIVCQVLSRPTQWDYMPPDITSVAQAAILGTRV